MEYNPTECDIPTAEMSAAVKKVSAKNTASGPDGVPDKAISLTLTGEKLAEMFDKCLCEGTMPRCWKMLSKLVLLPKPGKDPSSPSAYRPICLLNEVGKLFETVLMGRITEHLEKVGSDIHVNQYGFRPGRSTIDAINRVKHIADGAVKQGVVALAVSVDIVNAFNSIPWRAI